MTPQFTVRGNFDLFPVFLICGFPVILNTKDNLILIRKCLKKNIIIFMNK
jgi:hypothetical protein